MRRKGGKEGKYLIIQEKERIMSEEGVVGTDGRDKTSI